MISLSEWLWILFAANTAAYYYLGRKVVSQPIHNHPKLFWGWRMKWAAVVLPPNIFIALTVAGFALTDSGWKLFWASVFVYCLFVVRPRMIEW